MQIRCYRCGANLTLGKEEVAFALQALEESGGTHYDARCHRCRHTNKVPLEQLRRLAPAASSKPQEPQEPQEPPQDAE